MHAKQGIPSLPFCHLVTHKNEFYFVLPHWPKMCPKFRLCFYFFSSHFFFIFVASRHHFESIPHYDGLEIKVDLIVVGIFRPPWLNWCSAAWLYAETFLLAPWYHQMELTFYSLYRRETELENFFKKSERKVSLAKVFNFQWRKRLLWCFCSYMCKLRYHRGRIMDNPFLKIIGLAIFF